jgi:ankyrin repeat protein
LTDLDLIITAIEQDDVAAIQSILDHNRELVNQQDARGATPLHYAALNGRRRIAQLLVERGADVNQRDKQFGATPAGWAIEYLRELGGHLAIEFEDLAHAIRTIDVKWAARFLMRFPSLRAGIYRNGTTFRQLAIDSGNSQIAELFEDVPA